MSISSIHQKLGTAGFIISILALVVALGGGAYAASGGLTGKQKKEVEKIAKKYAGKPGAAGTVGPAGPAGAKGDAGAAGNNGASGTSGANGTSVTSKAISTGSATCNHQGGTELTSASGTEKVCNGQTGFTETLPSGKTETGAWSVGMTPTGFLGPALVPISFNIPLLSELEGTQVHYVKPSETPPTACEGGTAGAPVAEPGNLCVYAGEEGAFIHFGQISNPATAGRSKGAGATGALLEFSGEEEGIAWGTWAVTAE